MIAIDEDNTPSLRDLEDPRRFETARTFHFLLEPGRMAFASFSQYRPGIHAHTSAATPEAIDHAMQDLTLLTVARRLGSLESTLSGTPTRALEMDLPHHRQLFIHVGIVCFSAEEAGIQPPSDEELYQIFSFLTRCRPLG